MRNFSLPLLTICIFLFGCSDTNTAKRLDEFEKSAGDWRFIGITPKTTVQILRKELIKPDSEFGSPKVRLTGVFRQEAPFPVAQYNAAVEFKVSKGDREVGSGSTDLVKMAESTGAFSAEIILYDLDTKDASTVSISDFKITLGEFNWFPILRGKESVKLVD